MKQSIIEKNYLLTLNYIKHLVTIINYIYNLILKYSCLNLMHMFWVTFNESIVSPLKIIKWPEIVR